MKTALNNYFFRLFIVSSFLMTTALFNQAIAQQKAAEIEGVSYNVNSSMAENLKALNGRVVYFSLDSGKTFTGIVKAVGNHLVHVEKLEGKEFFDALISIEAIRAIDTRFRDIQR